MKNSAEKLIVRSVCGHVRGVGPYALGSCSNRRLSPSLLRPLGLNLWHTTNGKVMSKARTQPRQLYEQSIQLDHDDC